MELFNLHSMETWEKCSFPGMKQRVSVMMSHPELGIKRLKQ